MSRLALLVCLLGCDHFYSVRGTVRSCADRQPIADAAVTTSKGTGRTDANGEFKFVLNRPHSDIDTVTLDVQKDRFQPAKQPDVHSEKPVEICLQPAPAP